LVAELIKFICVLFVNVIIVQIFHLNIVSKIENIIIYKMSQCFSLKTYFKFFQNEEQEVGKRIKREIMMIYKVIH